MNKLEKEARDYLAKYRIEELMTHLCAAVAYRLPEDMNAFLIQELLRLKVGGPLYGLFDASEFSAVFASVDVSLRGLIGREEARIAMRSLAISQLQENKIMALSIPEFVSEMEKYLSFNRPSYEGMSSSGSPPASASGGAKSLTFKNAWVLWEKPVQTHSNDHDHYTTAMRVLSRMSNVEEFWKYWLCVPQPSELLEGKHFVREVNAQGDLNQIDTLMLFREGIRPEWEDAANATGGHFQYMFKPTGMPPGQIDEYWNNVAIGIMSGCVQPYDMITGIRLLDKSTVGRNACIRVEVWFRDFANTEAVNQLKQSLEQCMGRKLDGTVGQAPKGEIKSHAS